MDFHYSEPRFKMPYWGRFAIRLLTYAGGAVVIAGGCVLFLSDIVPLKAISILICVLSLSYLLRIGKSQRSLKKASEKNLNIAEYLSPAAYREVEVALDRTALEESDFTLNLFGELLKTAHARKAISGIGVSADEFIAKIDSRRKRLSRSQGRDEMTRIIISCMALAFEDARGRGADSITPSHLLRALLKGEFPEVAKTFEIFGHKSSDLLGVL